MRAGSARQRVDPAARGRLRVPAATAWTYAMGVEPQFAQEGKR